MSFIKLNVYSIMFFLSIFAVNGQDQNIRCKKSMPKSRFLPPLQSSNHSLKPLPQSSPFSTPLNKAINISDNGSKLSSPLANTALDKPNHGSILPKLNVSLPEGMPSKPTPIRRNAISEVIIISQQLNPLLIAPSSRANPKNDVIGASLGEFNQAPSLDHLPWEKSDFSDIFALYLSQSAAAEKTFQTEQNALNRKARSKYLKTIFKYRKQEDF